MFMTLAEVAKSNSEISQAFYWYVPFALVVGFAIGLFFTFVVVSHTNNKKIFLGISRRIACMFGIVKVFPYGFVMYCDNTTNNKPIIVIIPNGY